MFGLNESSHEDFSLFFLNQQQVNLKHKRSQKKCLLLQASTLQTSQLCLLTPIISSSGPIRIVQKIIS